ncbi:hypothetical protein VCHA54P496_190006 [Vibrio chagasii]|nr:hypothetical protein VCHA54P495_190006 [Vibrio chagasii]CAH7030597.1 hypothetical protein VCHA54P496_190006 [Vibrio chagasii]CAH7317112.1 hypothetical protein VCHA54P486_210053 [Vibrio chagasii]CAH7467675.1 hypothetical protein VCHA39O224_50128 [Vibrio chagasii]
MAFSLRATPNLPSLEWPFCVVFVSKSSVTPPNITSFVASRIMTNG